MEVLFSEGWTKRFRDGCPDRALIALNWDRQPLLAGPFLTFFAFL